MSIETNRREFLTRAGMGFGALAAGSLLSGQKAAGATAKPETLAIAAAA